MSLAGKLQRFLDKHGVHYHENKRAYVIACLSPACAKEDHCYLWKSDGGAICFRCGRKWRWKRVVAAIANCPIEEAHQAFFGRGAGGELEKPLEIDQLFGIIDEDEEQEEVFNEPVVVMGPDFVEAYWSAGAIPYLASRGLIAEDIEHFDIRYHALMDAVVFPVKRNGIIYGWQARRVAPKEEELRLISSTGFKKGKFLLNYDRAKFFDRVVLVEGPFDCVKADLKGAKGVTGIASFGKNVSQDQIKLILDLPAKHIFLGLDPDASEEVYEVLRRIGTGKTVYRVWPPKHRKDFGECTREEVEAAIKAAVLITCPADLLDVYLK
jgi:hypothetical protein